jgi:2-dehydro-3-deoxygalactonokinase
VERQSALIGIDWGTTSARAFLFDRDGALLAQRDAPLGISKVAGGAFAPALATLLGDWNTQAGPRLASGMIGSRQGWVEAPYLRCPASLSDLAASLATTPDGALRIVPGLLAENSGGIPDVMRGEETQLVGAVAAEETVVAVLPGTHSKWARIERGTVADFATYLTGELYGVLMEHSILGRMASASPTAPGPAFARGVECGLASDGLTHDLFGARTLALTGGLAAHEVADWLSGLLIGAEIRAAQAWLGDLRAPVRIIGADALTLRYERAMGVAGLPFERGALDAAARGLWRIAKQAGLV